MKTKVKATKRHRPVLQWKPPPGIDSRTRTRLATPDEVAKATSMLQDLEVNFLKVGLVPAPDPHFDGHMVHAKLSENPAWYRKFAEGRWNRDGCQVKRSRVMQALKRVIGGRVRGNGYEVELLKLHEKHGS